VGEVRDEIRGRSGRETNLSDGSEVVNEIGLGHSDSSVSDGKGLLLLVGGDSDVEILWE